MEEGPYLGLTQATRFRDMEIIARHILGPEELQRIAHYPGSGFTPLSGKSGHRGGRSPEHQVQCHQANRVGYPS